MTSVDLSFAGRLSDTSPTLTAIARARVNDPAHLERKDEKWIIVDGMGCQIGRMAANWSPLARTRLVEGKVGAVVRWRKSDNDERFQTYIKRDEWETVLPEFVFRST